MSYLPPGMPVPIAGPDDAPFWEACNRRELRIQRCADCGTFRHPPVPVCAACRSMQREWALVPGTGSVFSYTIAAHPTHPALRGHPPYNIAVVHLDGAGDVRLVTNIMDVATEDITIGMRVRLHWDELPDGQCLPRFVPLHEGAANA
jgi:uncharacterized OB-fold protein